MKNFFKIFLSVLLLAAFAFGLAIVINKSSKEDNHLFYATIVEESNSLIVVRPFDGSRELNSSDKIALSKSCADESIQSLLKVGNTIIIKYDGIILESYPAQINGDKIWINSIKNNIKNTSENLGHNIIDKDTSIINIILPTI